MRIAVTGGAGFIGRATITAAELAGHEAWSFDRAHGQDVLDPGSLRALRGSDHVIHLAGMLGTAELFGDPHGAIDVNVHGALNVLEACERWDLGYVGITMPPVFPSVYTATKLAADRLASAWHHSRGVLVSHVRAFNAYGFGQKHGPGHPQKIVPTFATRAWAGQPIPIWGDGNQTVDLVHADDLGRLLVDATGHGDDVVFDGGTGVALTVNEVAQMVLEVTGSSAGVEYLPMRDGERPTTIVAKGAGWERLTWQPTFDPERLAAAVWSYRP